MKLNTRVLLLVTPVILLSAAISSYGIYQNQKDSLIKRETSYLQLTMEKLAGHFRQSYSLINSYALTISRSDIVQQYLNVPDNPVVEMKMLANLQGSIASFESISNDSIGIAVLDNQFTPRFYLDNTYDPLSKIDNQVLKYIQRTFTQVSPQQHIALAGINKVEAY